MWRICYTVCTKQESSGVSPLKNEDGFLKSDSHSKANIPNTNFRLSLPKKVPPHYQIKDLAHIQIFLPLKWTGKGYTNSSRDWNPSRLHTGPDSIPAFILNAAADQLAPILTTLYQTSLDCGQIPTDWRDARIVPVYKKGDKHKPANYRLVSLTSSTCKLLEHIIHSNVMTILTSTISLRTINTAL